MTSLQTVHFDMNNRSCLKKWGVWRFWTAHTAFTDCEGREFPFRVRFDSEKAEWCYPWWRWRYSRTNACHNGQYKFCACPCRCGLSNVVKTNVYLRDPSNFTALNGVYSSYFTDGNRLVRTCLQNHMITGIEIDVIAYCRCDRVSSDAVRWKPIKKESRVRWAMGTAQIVTLRVCAKLLSIWNFITFVIKLNSDLFVKMWNWPSVLPHERNYLELTESNNITFIKVDCFNRCICDIYKL